jgi:hypothetical protein
MNDNAKMSPFARGAVAGALQAVLWAGAVAVLVLVVPRFAVVFTDLGVDLSALSKIVILVSYVVHGYWYVAAAMIVAWPPTNGALTRLLFADPGAEALLGMWRLATWLAPVFVLSLIAATILLWLADLSAALS